MKKIMLIVLTIIFTAHGKTHCMENNNENIYTININENLNENQNNHQLLTVVRRQENNCSKITKAGFYSTLTTGGALWFAGSVGGLGLAAYSAVNGYGTSPIGPLLSMAISGGFTTLTGVEAYKSIKKLICNQQTSEQQ